MDASEAFWITAGQAGAIVGGVVAATVTGAMVVSRKLDEMVSSEAASLDARTAV
jgi:hypothetical protein